MAKQERQVGDIIIGKYEIVRHLGRGGSGTVYLATDLTLKRDVAIKELVNTPETRSEGQFEQISSRFEREAHLNAQFSGYPVITVYGRETDEQGNVYLIMEYAPYGSLDDKITQPTRHPLTLNEFYPLAFDILRAVQAVHKHPHGIVHRDIKPSNILLTENGARLADFGIAQLADESSRSRAIARSHPGTALYMSPEQEHDTGYLDNRSDLYSVGLVFYEMLTGQRYKQIRIMPPSKLNREVPPALDRLVVRALDRDREQRYNSADEILADLEQARQLPLAPTVESQARTLSDPISQPIYAAYSETTPFQTTPLPLPVAALDSSTVAAPNNPTVVSAQPLPFTVVSAQPVPPVTNPTHSKGVAGVTVVLGLILLIVLIVAIGISLAGNSNKTNPILTGNNSTNPPVTFIGVSRGLGGADTTPSTSPSTKTPIASGGAVSYGAVASSNALFQDNFANGPKPDWKPVDDSGYAPWTVDNGGYTLLAGTGSKGLSYVGKPDWTDYSVNLTLGYSYSGIVQVQLRVQDSNNYVAFSIKDGQAQWLAVRSGQTQVLNQNKVDICCSSSYKLKLTVRGTSLIAYNGDNQLIAANVGQLNKDLLPTSGYVGLYLEPGSRATSLFYDIDVTKL